MLQGPYFSVNYIIMTTIIHCKNCIYFSSLQYMFQGCANIRLSAVNIPLCSLGGWIFVTTVHATRYVCEPLTVLCNLNYGKNDKTNLCPTKSYTIIPCPRRKGESLVCRQGPSINIYLTWYSDETVCRIYMKFSLGILYKKPFSKCLRFVKLGTVTVISYVKVLMNFCP
jgi:hypothetical protein